MRGLLSSTETREFGRLEIFAGLKCRRALTNGKKRISRSAESRVSRKEECNDTVFRASETITSESAFV